MQLYGYLRSDARSGQAARSRSLRSCSITAIITPGDVTGRSLRDTVLTSRQLYRGASSVFVAEAGLGKWNQFGRELPFLVASILAAWALLPAIDRISDPQQGLVDRSRPQITSSLSTRPYYLRFASPAFIDYIVSSEEKAEAWRDTVEMDFANSAAGTQNLPLPIVIVAPPGVDLHDVLISSGLEETWSQIIDMR